MALLERPLQLVQLIGGERGAIASMLLLAVVALRHPRRGAFVVRSTRRAFAVAQFRNAVVGVTTALACAQRTKTSILMCLHSN